MKLFSLLVVLIMSSPAWAARDAASQFVFDVGQNAMQVLEKDTEEERFTGMCRLLKTNIHASYIAGIWLGKHKSLGRDQAAITEFTELIPSIVIMKAVQAMSGGDGDEETSGSFSVGDKATDRGNSVYEVAVRIETGGSRYNVFPLVHNGHDRFRFLDIEYMGFSAVHYSASEYLDVLDEAYSQNPKSSMPVTELVKYVKAQDGFARCP